MDLERVINLLDIVLECNDLKEVRRVQAKFSVLKIGCVGSTFLPHSQICKYIFSIMA